MKKTRRTRKVWTGMNSSYRQGEKIAKKDTRIQTTKKGERKRPGDNCRSISMGFYNIKVNFKLLHFRTEHLFLPWFLPSATWKFPESLSKFPGPDFHLQAGNSARKVYPGL